jgi:hypothetical protein
LILFYQLCGGEARGLYGLNEFLAVQDFDEFSKQSLAGEEPDLLLAGEFNQFARHSFPQKR